MKAGAGRRMYVMQGSTRNDTTDLLIFNFSRQRSCGEDPKKASRKLRSFKPCEALSRSEGSLFLPSPREALGGLGDPINETPSNGERGKNSKKRSIF